MGIDGKGVRVAAVQMRSRPGEVSRNRATAQRLIDQYVDSSVKLILLPELFNVGYFLGPELFELWETADGPTVTWMRELAAGSGALICGSIAERRGNSLLNTLFLAEPDGRLHRYSKRRPTKTERAAFDAGTERGIVVTSLGRLGLLICADYNWGEALLQPLAGKVDLILLPTASMAPALFGRLMLQWEQRRGSPFLAQMNQLIGAPAILAGMIGPVQRLTRFFECKLSGGTWITDAQGHALASVPYNTEGVAVAEVEIRSTSGEPQARTFRDPGRVHGLLDRLLLPLPDMRPQAPGD